MKTDALEAPVAEPQRFEATYDLVSSSLVLFYDQGRILKVNDSFAELLGYAMPELLSKPFLDLLQRANCEILHASHDPGIPASLIDLPLGLRYRHKDGNMLHGRSKLAVVGRLLLGEIVWIEAPLSPDVCPEKDRWLQRIVETAPGIIGNSRLDRDGLVSLPWISPGYEKYYGVTLDELRQDAGILFERLHPEDVARVQAPIAESVRTLRRWKCEYRVRHLLKGKIWLEGRSTPTLKADDAILWFGFLHDISERKRIEHALRESEERFCQAFDSAAIGMALLALDGRWLRVNRYICEFLRRIEEKLLWTSSPDLTHPYDLACELNEIRRLLAGETPYLRLEKSFQHRDDHYCQVRLTTSLIRGDNGAPLNLVAQVEDLSRLAEAEQHLSLMDIVLGHVHEAAYLIDTQAHFRYVNHQACRSLGCSREELFAITLAEIYPDWSSAQVLSDWHDNPERPAEIIETRHRTKGSCIFPVELSAAYPELDGHSYSLELARDISERKRLQAAQEESEWCIREIFEHSSDCLYLFEVSADRRFRYIEVNAAFERTSGLRREQVIGRHLGEAATAAGDRVMAGLAHCLARGENIEEEFVIELPARVIALQSTFRCMTRADASTASSASAATSANASV